MTIQKNTVSKETSSEFVLQRVYAAVSSEIPSVPEAFTMTESPQLDVKLNVENKATDSKFGTHVVELTIVVTAQHKQKTLFLIEVKQGGVFTIKGFDDAMLAQVINIQCPTILYPYASARLAELVLYAGFIPFHLPPVDFNAMHEQKLRS